MCDTYVVISGVCTPVKLTGKWYIRESDALCLQVSYKTKWLFGLYETTTTQFFCENEFRDVQICSSKQ